MTMYSPFSLLFLKLCIKTSSFSSLLTSYTNDEICLLFGFFPITLTKKVDFSQASPSYEVAMEISKGKEKGIVLVFGF